MSFDVDAALVQMSSAIRGVVSDQWPGIKSYAEQVLEGEKDTLKKLADLRISGGLTQEEFDSELDDERRTVEAQFEALQVMSKAMSQRAANAAIKALTDIVQAALLL